MVLWSLRALAIHLEVNATLRDRGQPPGWPGEQGSDIFLPRFVVWANIWYVVCELLSTYWE